MYTSSLSRFLLFKVIVTMLKAIENPCTVCRTQVTKKTGVVCKGPCKRWIHFKCLDYKECVKQDIARGNIEVTCVCPGCDTVHQFDPNDEAYCCGRNCRGKLTAPLSSFIADDGNCPRAKKGTCPGKSVKALERATGDTRKEEKAKRKLRAEEKKIDLLEQKITGYTGPVVRKIYCKCCDCNVPCAGSIKTQKQLRIAELKKMQEEKRKKLLEEQKKIKEEKRKIKEGQKLLKAKANQVCHPDDDWPLCGKNICPEPEENVCPPENNLLPCSEETCHEDNKKVGSADGNDGFCDSKTCHKDEEVGPFDSDLPLCCGTNCEGENEDVGPTNDGSPHSGKKRNKKKKGKKEHNADNNETKEKDEEDPEEAMPAPRILEASKRVRISNSSGLHTDIDDKVSEGIIPKSKEGQGEKDKKQGETSQGENAEMSNADDNGKKCDAACNDRGQAEKGNRKARVITDKGNYVKISNDPDDPKPVCKKSCAGQDMYIKKEKSTVAQAITSPNWCKINIPEYKANKMPSSKFCKETVNGLGSLERLKVMQLHVSTLDLNNKIIPIEFCEENVEREYFMKDYDGLKSSSFQYQQKSEKLSVLDYQLHPGKKGKEIKDLDEFSKAKDQEILTNLSVSNRKYTLENATKSIGTDVTPLFSYGITSPDESLEDILNSKWLQDAIMSMFRNVEQIAKQFNNFLIDRPKYSVLQ